MRKIVNTTKRWMFISMLFLGISLTVYAAVSPVIISNISASNIEATTADISVVYSGAARLWFYASFTPDGEFHLVTSIATPSEGFCYMTYYLGGLTPNTTYYLKIRAGNDPNDPDEGDYVDSDVISFTTAIE